MIKFENPNGYIEITNAYFCHPCGACRSVLLWRDRYG